MSDDSNEAYWEQQFELLQSEPVVWAMDADSLMRSFEIIAQQAERDLDDRVAQSIAKGDTPNPIPYVPRVDANAIFLGALATEVLLKGIAVAQPQIKQAVQSKDKKICSRLWTHNLLKIADLAGVQLDQPETALCKTLETFLKWAGRYSTPKNHEDMMPQPLESGGLAPPNVFSSMDFNHIRALNKRLRDQLPNW
ncbi:hypothetical protein BL243_24220 [Ralstonia solanacearum]|nr:hypothetical protein BL243_24220 [Ralstonia solanacearum]